MQKNKLQVTLTPVFGSALLPRGVCLPRCYSGVFHNERHLAGSKVKVFLLQVFFCPGEASASGIYTPRCCYCPPPPTPTHTHQSDRVTGTRWPTFSVCGQIFSKQQQLERCFHSRILNVSKWTYLISQYLPLYCMEKLFFSFRCFYIFLFCK